MGGSMGFDEIINNIQQYIQANPEGSIAAGVILLVLLFKKPKLFFTLLFLCAAGIGVMVLFDKLSSTGLSDKNFRSLQELK